MVVQPKIRGFICTTSHPEGCRANVERQIAYIKQQPGTGGAKKVLVIGASAGYGLASRISCAYSCGAATVGVIFDKPSSGSRTATAGWYNTSAFESCAHRDGLYAKTINGDAFSKEIKERTIDLIKRDLGKVDLVVYSLASPRRAVEDGSTYTSVLKTTGQAYTNKTIDLRSGEVTRVTLSPATQREIDDTVKVMGGEDWKDWIAALKQADALEEHAVTVAYSYIGPELTHPMYLNGSIGQAKRHLHATAREITRAFDGVKGYVSVNKALVTQSSAAIPIVPLYISILYRVMKRQGCHEGCIEQMYRLFHDKLLVDCPAVDADGLIRVDDWEMREDVQARVNEVWDRIDTDNAEQIADIAGYWEDFYQMFGFSLPGVDYGKDVSLDVSIPSLEG